MGKEPTRYFNGLRLLAKPDHLNWIPQTHMVSANCHCKNSPVGKSLLYKDQENSWALEMATQTYTPALQVSREEIEG